MTGVGTPPFGLGGTKVSLAGIEPWEGGLVAIERPCCLLLIRRLDPKRISIGRLSLLSCSKSKV